MTNQLNMAEQIQHFGNRFGYFHGQKTRRNLLPVKIADNRQVGGGGVHGNPILFLGSALWYGIAIYISTTVASSSM